MTTNTSKPASSSVVSFAVYVKACGTFGVQAVSYLKLPAVHELPKDPLFKSFKAERAGQSQVEPLRIGRHTHTGGGAPLVRLTFEARRARRPKP